MVLKMLNEIIHNHLIIVKNNKKIFNENKKGNTIHQVSNARNAKNNKFLLLHHNIHTFSVF